MVHAPMGSLAGHIYPRPREQDLQARGPQARPLHPTMTAALSATVPAPTEHYDGPAGGPRAHPATRKTSAAGAVPGFREKAGPGAPGET